MDDKTKLERIRELAMSKVLEIQPLAGEEMNLPQSDPHRDGFINGERTFAAQILALLDGKESDGLVEPINSSR
jgi:hypothetical protein